MPFPYHQIIGEFIAFITGIFCLHKLNSAFRIVAFHAILAFSIEMFGYWWHQDKQRGSNQWMYNLYIIADCGLVLLSAYFFLKPKIHIIFFGSLFLVLIVFWINSAIQNKSIDKFIVEAYVIDSIFALGLFLYILYRYALNEKGKLISMPVLWLCLGLIINYGCSIPYFSTYSIQGKMCSKAEMEFLNKIPTILNNVRYPLVALSFVLFYFQSSSKVVSKINALQ